MQAVPSPADTEADERVRRIKEAQDGWIKPKPVDRNEADKPRI